jgi:hypothetical protein
VSETWESTRKSVNRLKEAWSEADEDSRWNIGFWAAGLAMMAGAIVAQFGWTGAIFCIGVIVYAAGYHALKS